MSDIPSLHQDQIDYWNNAGAQKWVAAQANTDIMLAPISEVLLKHAEIRAGMGIVDIGCGCGATTLDLAKAVGPAGRILAVDVSEPMVAVARSRLAPYAYVNLVCADASTYPFTPFADLIFSRFGVMFFGGPAEAFVNIRGALKPNGRLLFACWRELKENPWMQVPLHAAYAAGVPRMQRPGPNDPGPFSFADRSRVTSILSEAGFAEPRFTARDMLIDIAAGGGLAGAVTQSITIGATSRALRDQPENLRHAAKLAIEKALMPFVKGETVPMPAGIWIVESEVA